MRVGIHQPHYLPWLRYFEKIARCDVFVVLNTVQYSKNGWQNRNRIKTASGTTLLTVPVHAPFGERLSEVRVQTDKPWRKKHWRTIAQNYAKAPAFEEHRPFIEDAYGRDWQTLDDLNAHMLAYFLSALEITTEVVYASDLDVPGDATERLVNLVRAVGGDRYYSGAYALDAYLDTEAFEKAAIALDLQQWRAPEYPQLHGAFEPDLAILDLLLNCGDESLGVLLGERP